MATQSTDSQAERLARERGLEVEKQRLREERFPKLLATYADFGDVSNLEFGDDGWLTSWWAEHAWRFRMPVQKPTPQVIARLGWGEEYALALP